jgi:hypothetical protein
MTQYHLHYRDRAVASNLNWEPWMEYTPGGNYETPIFISVFSAQEYLAQWGDPVANYQYRIVEYDYLSNLECVTTIRWTGSWLAALEIISTPDDLEYL